MFRFEFFAEDKKVGLILKALTGLVVEMKPPQYVENAEKKGGEVVASSGGSIVDRLIHKMMAGQITAITKQELFKLLGGSTPMSSLNNPVKDLIDLGVLKRVKRGNYAVNLNKAKGV